MPLMFALAATAVMKENPVTIFPRRSPPHHEAHRGKCYLMQTRNPVKLFLNFTFPVIARASIRSNLIHAAIYGIASSAFGLLAMTKGASFRAMSSSCIGWRTAIRS
jgi:hypothetical protein